MTEIRIIPSEECYAEGLNRALDLVARERRYIGFLEAPPLDGTLSHLRNILAGDGVQMLAVTQTEDVVGWCDIFAIDSKDSATLDGWESLYFPPIEEKG